MKTSVFKLVHLVAFAVGASLPLVLNQNLMAGEDEARRPFAEWAEVPEPGQLIFGTLYEQSEAYHVWAQGNNRMPANTRVGGENYGIDVRQGYFTFNYGITKKWAADLNLGATTVGWRPFDGGDIQKTTGVMDPTFGVRYQIFNETDTDAPPWLPTLTFRAGAIVPGVYDRHLAFTTGNHGVAIEPSILFRKHLGWEGFGIWGDVLYRWEHTIGADQYIAAAGVFQQIKGWELDPATGICRRFRVKTLCWARERRGSRAPTTASPIRLTCGKSAIPLTRASVTQPPNGTSAGGSMPAKLLTGAIPTRPFGWARRWTFRWIGSRQNNRAAAGKFTCLVPADLFHCRP